MRSAALVTALVQLKEDARRAVLGSSDDGTSTAIGVARPLFDDHCLDGSEHHEAC